VDDDDGVDDDDDGGDGGDDGDDEAERDDWYDPDDGLKTAAALIAHFQADPKASKDPYMPAFLEELGEFQEALREAKRRGRRFRLSLNN
jgi:hypothetical protein